jgi:hypothetical protein
VWTQGSGEGLTDGGLLARIKDTAAMGQPRLARVGGQPMRAEGGRRVVGRVILDAEPRDDRTFGPVALESFPRVPAAVAAPGFPGPRPGDDFAYHRVSTSFPGVIHGHP